MEKIYNADGTFYYAETGNTIKVVTDDLTLGVNDSGKTFLIGTDAKVITLPSTKKGVKYTFINIGADGNNIITISPATADAIHGIITLAATVVKLSGVDNKDLINTKSTATTGDSVTLEADGDAGWYVTSSTGIWASEA